jgi:CheY-like chemotaxis protein
MSKKVLVVEDQQYWHDYWRQEVGSRADLVVALSIGQAEDFFYDNPGPEAWSAIVVDDCVPGDELTTLQMVDNFRSLHYEGPIIAVSSSTDHLRRLLDCGCSHYCTKENLPAKLSAVLSA